MALTTRMKSCVNLGLQYLNLHLETLTAERLERRRLETLVKAGHFTRPIYPLPQAFKSLQITPAFNDVATHNRRFDCLQDPSFNDVAYSFDNQYFSSPDAEVAYTIVRRFTPKLIIEIGSGYSTKILRQAIFDSQVNTQLVCIDPNPRVEIAGMADEVYHERIEMLGRKDLFQSLDDGDILFIDSSHAICTGNDVVFLYLIALPLLRSGVLVHIHDIFLPYDYPEEWVVRRRRGWNEQYLVQALLTETVTFEVLWPGHFLQRTRPNFGQHFPHLNGRAAQSLWIRKI